MSRAWTLAAAACITLAACADAAPVASPAAPRATLTSSSPLAVDVEGPTRLNSPGTASFEAFPEGDPSQYYYEWVSQVCLKNHCYEPNVFATGVGASTASLQMGADFYKVRVSVHVRENQEVHRSGVSSTLVLGPASLVQNGTATPSLCRPVTHFPHTEWDVVTWNGIVTVVFVGRYGRDCQGTRVNAP